MKQTTVFAEEAGYSLWLPEDGGRRPLVIVLPEKGAEADAQAAAGHFTSEAVQQENPCCVLLPKAAGGWDGWPQAQALHQAVFQLEGQGLIDPDRVYLLGGTGAWFVGARFPWRFAAVAPAAGWADPHLARSLKSTPVWAFHAEDDQIVPVSGVTMEGGLRASTRRTVMALRTCGSACVRCTEFPAGEMEGPHALWRAILCGGAEPGFTPWLFGQDRKKRFQVEFMRPGLWRIDDYFTSSCYLVTGTEKALLIDTGMGEGDLPALVKSLTPLPVEVAITHPHRDHMALAGQFDKVYLHEKDIDRLQEYAHQMESFFGSTGPAAPSLSQLSPIREGSRIDLGGGVVIETAELGGHTDNSVVFIDKAHQAIFMGDAIGSGYIALMICELPQWRDVITRYKEELGRFNKRLGDLKGYAWLGGHFIQENGCNPVAQEYFHSGTSDYFCPISTEIAADMEVLCGKLLSGEITEKDLLSTPEHYCGYGTAGMLFRFTDLV